MTTNPTAQNSTADHAAGVEGARRSITRKYAICICGELFAGDPQRGERLTAEAAGLYLDYSKNRVTDETIALLLRLAEECGLAERIDAMFSGEKINVTEQRAVLHVALRAPENERILVDGVDVVPEVHAVLDRMAAFSEESAAAAGADTRIGPSATSSTSASAALISARSWPTRRCVITAGAI